jgi:hypothetical protein
VRTFGRIMLAVAGFLVLIGVVYTIFANEPVGKVLLLLSGVLALIVGVFLEVTTRPPRTMQVDAGAGGATAQEDAYLPHASVWPFWLGVASFVVANGLALGLWGLIPGGILMVIAVVGFAGQSRRRA